MVAVNTVAFFFAQKGADNAILNRLKLELSKQQYFTDEQYTQFLSENDLTPEAEYNKATMQKNLLNAVVASCIQRKYSYSSGRL